MADPQAAIGILDTAPRVRRRNRHINSCLECRRRKLRCDRAAPCGNCARNNRSCVFLAPSLDSASQLKLTQIKEQMGSLERVLEQDVARRATAAAGAEVPMPEDEKDLEPSPLATVDAFFDDDVGNESELFDLGIALGRLRLTDRLGGYFRPQLADEVSC
jgi:hypothetical protein